MISQTVIYHFTPYFPSCSNCTLLFVANSNNETNRSFVNSFKRTSIAQFVACTRSFYPQRNIIENNYDRKVCMTFCKSVSKNQKFHFSMINRFCTHSRAGRNTLYKAHFESIKSIALLFWFSFLFFAHSATLFHRNLRCCYKRTVGVHIVCSWKGIASVSKTIEKHYKLFDCLRSYLLPDHMQLARVHCLEYSKVK